MFGIGKKKIKIGQFSRLVQLRIYDEKLPMDIKSLDRENVLSEQELKILNADLFVFRFVVFSLLLTKTALIIRSKRTPYDLGNICTYSLKLILEDKGFTQENLDEFEEIYSKEMEYQIELLTKMEQVDTETYESLVTVGFTKYFGALFGFATPTKENGELQISNYKEAITLHITSFVFKVVEQIFQEEYQNYKITDF